MRQRYSAQYVTEDAETLYGPDYDVDKYSTVVGLDLAEVVARAKRQNYSTQDECYSVCLEECDRHGEWVPVEHYDCFDLSVTT